MVCRFEQAVTPSTGYVGGWCRILGTVTERTQTLTRNGRLGLTQRQVADLMGVTPGRVSQIENGDLDVNEVATLSRYAQALGAKMWIIFAYGNDLRQIA
ncbi:helix-turn-helix domain-containing protein [Winogradskya humida]